DRPVHPRVVLRVAVVDGSHDGVATGALRQAGQQLGDTDAWDAGSDRPERPPGALRGLRPWGPEGQMTGRAAAEDHDDRFCPMGPGRACTSRAEPVIPEEAQGPKPAGRQESSTR